MTEAKRLLAAFEGSSAAHGKTTVGRIGRNGKAEAKSKVEREPLTEAMVQEHINGGQGVGAIPINVENMCKFGALDIDTYDLDIKALNEKVQKMKLPLILCRSKSGGAHLFLFLKEWEPAALIREYLTEFSIALGYSGCEIFPKQDKILAERGDVGNFINMPYHNADMTTRYALDERGDAMDLKEFLDAVDRKRVSAVQIDKLHYSGTRAYFTDGPYCLEVIASQGPVSTNRNTFMFNAGIYCRLKWPDDWKRHHEEYNRILCSPALDAQEMVQLQKSLDKNSKYFYQCDQCPLRDYCDKNICKTRPFGVGNSAEDTVKVSGLTIMLSEPRLYFMDVDGSRVELSTEQLQNPTLWQRACMAQIQKCPPVMKPNKWQKLVSELMESATLLEVPEELTIHGQFKEHLRVYCTSRIRATAPEEMELGKPWTDNGVTKFTMAGLMQFLKNRGFTEYTRAQVQEQLRKINGTDDCESHQWIRKQNGKGSTIRVWWVPAFDAEEVELETKEISNDVPF